VHGEALDRWVFGGWDGPIMASVMRSSAHPCDARYLTSLHTGPGSSLTAYKMDFLDWPFFFLHLALAVLSRLPVMSSLIRKFSKRLDQYSEARAPVDTDGAPPPIGVHEKKANEVLALLKRPPATAADLVSTAYMIIFPGIEPSVISSSPRSSMP
jgi:hypothetical protein